MQDTLWLMDMDFKTVWISPSVVKTRGFTLAELQSMPLEKNLTPESYDIALKILSEEMTPERLADRNCEISRMVELEFICKDGSRFIGEISMTLLRDSEGKPSGIMWVGRDISERRKAELALRISEEKYRNIFDNAILGIYRSTPEGTYEEMNQAFADIVGYGSPKEMMAAITDIQKQLYVNPEDRTKIGQMLASTGYVKGYEAELYHLDGHHVWISINSKAVKDEAGNILYYEGTVENITERKKTAEELRKSEERFRDIFENAVEGIFQTTLDGRFITVNPALARMHNCESPEDLIKKTGNIGEIYCDPKDREEVLRLLSENDVIEGYVNRFRRVSDGSIKWGSLNLRLVRDEDGNPQYIEGTCTDITEQKSAEEERMKMDEQLRQAQKLESIGVLAGGIAHDFNNMLMVIIGNTELALMDIPEKSPVVPRLNNINMVAMSAANLCKQMLAYSGKGFFQMAPLNLTGMINEMEQMLKTSISKKAKLDLHLDDEMPLIKADMSQIQQIIMNLVINASEAIGEKPGTITIKTGQKQCSAEYLKTFHLSDEIVEGLYVCMEISDTGCGMEKETLGKIFDPFFTTKFTGRGLGLAAVLGIVRSHKGAIRINSEPGKGSTFKILFPAIEFSPVKKEAEIKQGKDWHGSGTILLVDDDDQIRNVCKRILERIGFEVITAEDGKDGIDVFSKNRDKIRCVILDLTMPRMDGKEAYSELMLIDPDVKVIISSGYNEIEVMNSFKGKGLAGFIQKPYQLENMKDELKKVLG
jgi:PAS domain S-box-containing protein